MLVIGDPCDCKKEAVVTVVAVVMVVMADVDSATRQWQLQRDNNHEEEGSQMS
jgi:hypothetical protein